MPVLRRTAVESEDGRVGLGMCRSRASSVYGGLEGNLLRWTADDESELSVVDVADRGDSGEEQTMEDRWEWMNQLEDDEEAPKTRREEWKKKTTRLTSRRSCTPSDNSYSKLRSNEEFPRILEEHRERCPSVLFPSEVPPARSKEATLVSRVSRENHREEERENLPSDPTL